MRELSWWKKTSYPYISKVVYVKGTWGTETSKYPQEEKETSISKVAASEMGRGQTEQLRLIGVADCKAQV